jgi:acetyl-CoA synthetase
VRDYATAYQDFSLEKLEREVLQGSLVGGLNACIECCDRWADDDRPALDWVGHGDARETVTFRELKNASARFANLLRSHGKRYDTLTRASGSCRIQLAATVLACQKMGIVAGGTASRRAPAG